MKKYGLFFISLIAIGFSGKVFCESAKFSTETIKKKETDKCEITLNDGKTKVMDWCKSPCEKLYGPLPGKNCQ